MSIKKELVHQYMYAKRGKGHMPSILANILKQNEKLNKKFLACEHVSIDTIAKKLHITTYEVEILSLANGINLIHTVSGTYIDKKY